MNSAVQEGLESEEIHALSYELMQDIAECLDSQNKRAFSSLIKDLQPADLADILQSLNQSQRLQFIAYTPKETLGEILSCLDEDVRENVFDAIENKDYAEVVGQLSSDDVVDLIEDLEQEDQEEILAELPAQERVLIEESLSYPEESAGRLMQHEVATLPEHWNVGNTIDFMRTETSVLPTEDFYDLFVIDPQRKVLGKVPVSRVLREKRDVKIVDIMKTDIKQIPAQTDQEDIAHLFRSYGLMDAPVVDEGGRLLGVITVDDIVRVIDEEAEEDLMRLGGVAADDLYSATMKTTRQRFSWLSVNLLTAIIASLVIAQFAGVIEKIVALAVLMPIVASMAGNAGTQTLTVAVRAIAMRELNYNNVRRILWKEVLVGLINGALFAVLTGIITFFWFDSFVIALLIGCATIISLIIANLFGLLIPLGLAEASVDPAIASGVFLTTVTDVIAFLSFLGLASLILI